MELNIQMKIKRIRAWILSEFKENNFKNEPWETMWALYSLMISGCNEEELEKYIHTSIKWLFTRCNQDGVLISVHYMGFLLTVLNKVANDYPLNTEFANIYRRRSNDCLRYLKDEFIKNRKEGNQLWADEFWSVGHVLLGISEEKKNPQYFFNNGSFNKFLIKWYKDSWEPGRGWEDVLDTSFTLIGLGNYFVKREAHLRKAGPSMINNIRKEIADESKFKCKHLEKIDMTVWPNFHSRNFSLDEKKCFILMPYEKSWSAEVHKILKHILTEKNLNAVRADDMTKPNVIECIWEEINNASIIIADCTDTTPNVFFELGIAQTVGKDIIFITQDFKTLPFDIAHLRAIEYNLGEEGRENLKKKLFKYIDEIRKGVCF